MVTKSWMYDAILYIYALSLLFTFADFVERNPRAKRLSTGLLAFVWLLQTGFFIAHMASTNRFSLSSMFDSLFFFSWLMVTLSLILNYLLRIDFLLFFVNLVGFLATAFTFFSDETLSPLMQHWDVRDELLFIHVSLAMGSYAAFFFSALFSGMLLFLHAHLKRKQWSIAMKRMPSLDRIQKYAFRAVIIGIPLLLLSTALGVVWISLEKEWQLLGDVKVLTSVLLLVIYCAYLWKSFAGKTAWPRLALLNVLAFVVIIINYIFTQWFSDFH